jgi:glycosyltransferase involved in cell wall biosynthesis
MHNVLFYYSTQQVHTGSPRVLMRMVEGLDRTSFAPYFLSDNQEGDLCKELLKTGARIINGRTGQISAETLPSSLINIFRLTQLLKRFKISLVHINELGWNSELVVAARLLQLPIFFHIHNPIIENKKNINLRFGNKFLFVSEALALQCNVNTVPSSKAEILYNPIDIDKFQAGKSIREELGISESTPVIGAVAQICFRKGIDIFIDTAEKVLKLEPEARFLIAGPDATGEERFASEMRGRVVEKGLAPYVSFLGPRDDIDNFLASIDVFFLPTRAEPFGMVFVEAMAARVPVVASNVGGIPEIFPTKDYGLTFDPLSSEFSDCLIELIRNKDKREKIAEAAYGRARNEFSCSLFHNKLKGLYLEAISGGSQGI